jgi:hypothetical protein
MAVGSNMNMTAKNNVEKDKLDIDKLTNRFFDLFTNKDGKTPKVKDIKNIFIEEGLIISNTSGKPIVYSLQEFIETREIKLSDGTLTDFSENEVSHKTEVFDNMAQRFCLYEKSGKLNGKSFKSEGMKTIQFIKIDAEWRMACVAWSDKVNTTANNDLS